MCRAFHTFINLTQSQHAMKKIILIALSSLLLLLTACKTIEHIPGGDLLLGIDLRPYAEKDFLITPHAYNGDYISIYIIDYIIMPEGNYVIDEDSKSSPGSQESKVWIFEDIDAEAAVSGIYNHSIEMGADAIIDFKVEPYEIDWKFMPNPTTQKGMEITGIAIKRLD